MGAERLEKANYIPTVGLQYLFFAPFTIEGLPSNINTIGINVKWDLWDWGYKKHLMDEKQRGIEQSKLNLTETQTQVAIDVSNRYRKLREARAGLKVAQMAQEAEQQKLAVVNEQYKQNAALLSTLQTEQSTMAQTTAQYQQAVDTLSGVRTDLVSLLGATSPQAQSVSYYLAAALAAVGHYAAAAPLLHDLRPADLASAEPRDDWAPRLDALRGTILEGQGQAH